MTLKERYFTTSLQNQQQNQQQNLNQNQALNNLLCESSSRMNT